VKGVKRRIWQSVAEKERGFSFGWSFGPFGAKHERKREREIFRFV
jgi:hypothetical protein